MAFSFFTFNPARLRTFVFRLPFATRLLLLAIVALWIASIPVSWLQEWAALIPSKVGLQSSMWILFLFGMYIPADRGSQCTA